MDTQTPETSHTPNWDDEIATALREAQASATGTTKRGTRKSAQSVPPVEDVNLSAISAELDALLKPENFEALYEGVGELAVQLTGHPHWQLSQKEVKSLAVTTGTSARYLGIHDPKYLAFGLLGANMLMVFGPRCVSELRLRREEREITAKAQGKT